MDTSVHKFSFYILYTFYLIMTFRLKHAANCKNRCSFYNKRVVLLTELFL